MKRRLLLAGLAVAPFATASCDGGLVIENVTLPLGALRGAGEPLWQAVEQAHFALAQRPRDLAGKPGDAARAVMLYEYAAAEAGNGRLPDQWPARLMRDGRPHLRAAAGILGEATPQQVITALWAVAEALGQGDEAAARTAFASPVFRLPGEASREALAQLAVPPQAVRGLRALHEAMERERGPTR